MIPQHRSTPRVGEREETARDRDREREMETAKTEKSRRAREGEREEKEREGESGRYTGRDSKKSEMGRDKRRHSDRRGDGER